MKINDLYESEFLTDKEEILTYMSKTFRDFDPNKLTIEPDGLIYRGELSVRVDISKLLVRFKYINGNFYYSYKKVSTLEGCPQSVKGLFNCSGTNITTLKFFPHLVGHQVYCYSIKITDPKEYRYALYSEIGGIFESDSAEISRIINKYAGPDNRKYWPHAINLLSKVVLK